MCHYLRENESQDELLVDAFLQASQGYSADRVVADPDLDKAFLELCRSRGLNRSPQEMNLSLLNLRKRSGLPRSTRRTSFRNQDEFSFAAEMAVRCLERKHQTTLDRILCDPDLAAEFDKVCERIAPGFSSLEYRWAALALRKTCKLKPEMLGRAIPTVVVGPVAATELQIPQVPNQQGLYILTARDRVLYIGEARNLRLRLRKHLEHSDNKFLARHLWECGMTDLIIEYHLLPPNTRTDVRKAMELELIRSRRPELNVRR